MLNRHPHQIPIVLDNGTQITLEQRERMIRPGTIAEDLTLMAWSDDGAEGFEICTGEDAKALYSTIERFCKERAWFDINGEIPLPKSDHPVQVLVAVSFTEKPKDSGKTWSLSEGTTEFKNYIVRSEVHLDMGMWVRLAGGKMYSVETPVRYENGIVTYEVVGWRELPTPPEGQVDLIKSIATENGN